jgi:hypothetical protein
MPKSVGTFSVLSMLLLLRLVLGFPARPGELVRLSLENWDSLIDKRDPDSVWVIAFMVDAAPPCQQFLPVLAKAARNSDGMVNFGIVPADVENGLTMRFNVELLPTVFIIHKHGRLDYKGKRTERAIVSAAVKLIPDKSIPADLDWLSDGQEAAILFTEKKSTPPIWAAVSCCFQGRLRVGIASDPATIAAFKIEKVPTILLLNKSYRTVYTGGISFLEVKKTIGEFLSGEYEEPFPFNSDFFLPEEYQEEANNFSGFCVIHVVPDLDPKLKEAQVKFRMRKVKFFYGDEDLPFPWMQQGKLYVIHPQRKTGMVLDTVSDLALALSDIFQGARQLRPFDQLAA